MKKLSDYEYYRTESGVLYCGDCLEILPLIKENVDLVLTDPPYGITSLKWDIKNFAFLDLIKDIDNKIIFGNEIFSSKIRLSTNYKYDLYWLKNSPTGISLSKYQPMRVIENILICYTKNNKFNKQYINYSNETLKRWTGYNFIRGGKSKNHKCSGGVNTKNNYKCNPINLLPFKTVNNALGTNHPTEKPLQLIEWLIKTYTNKNDLILDPFLGSGTTAVACEKLNRRWIGIEISEKYCEIAKQRIKNEYDKLKLEFNNA